MPTLHEKTAESNADSLTILRALKDLAKRWRAGDEIAQYDEGKNFKPQTVAVSNIGELSRLLLKLEGKRQSCIIRGRFVGMDEAAKREELERDGYVFRRKSLFEDQPLHTVLVEVDDFEPITADPVTDPERAIAEYLATLPEPFRRAAYHWQLSNSAGHPTKAGLRVHLWFWLATPRSSADLKAWAEAVALPADRSVFDPIQIHYTSAPLFDDGITDPVPVRSGFHAGEADAVVIDIDEVPAIETRNAGRRQKALDTADSDPIAQHLNEKGLIKDAPRDGKLPIVCPFEGEHTADTGPSSTVYLLPHFNGHARGQFQCLHSHCIERTRAEFLEAIGYDDTAGCFGDENEGDAEGGNTKPLFRIVNNRILNLAPRADKLLSKEIYQRSYRLARIGGAREIPDASAFRITRDDDQPVILPVSAEFIRSRLNALARFETYRRREKEWIDIDCPKDLSSNIAGRGDWPTLRRLTALASAPFIRPDVTVCATPGHDVDTGVFYIPNAEFPAVHEAPTQRHAAEALAVLLAPFDEFPFTNEASRSAFAAHILTEAARIAIDLAPVFSYSAPEAGTGKTLLAEMPARIVHGHTPAMRPWTEGEELRKVLFASLLAGDRTIGFDDIGNGAKIRSKLLCGFVTARVWSDRVLGVSENRALSNNAVVFLTGNNITPAGNLARRSVVVRLDADADAEALRGRRFKIRDLKGYVDAHRGELLTAALTIVRAFAAAGCPEQATGLPSFEQWSRLARDPLLWLGMADPVDTQADETDDEAAPLVDTFRVLAETLRGEFTAEQLVETCTGVGDDGTLRNALQSAGCSNAEDPTKVRYWLRDSRARTAGGWKLERTSGRKARNATWKFVQKVAGSDLL